MVGETDRLGTVRRSVSEGRGPVPQLRRAQDHYRGRYPHVLDERVEPWLEVTGVGRFAASIGGATSSARCRPEPGECCHRWACPSGDAHFPTSQVIAVPRGTLSRCVIGGFRSACLAKRGACRAGTSGGHSERVGGPLSKGPHLAQVRASGAAHSSQNFVPVSFSCWHRG